MFERDIMALTGWQTERSHRSEPARLLFTRVGHLPELIFLLLILLRYVHICLPDNVTRMKIYWKTEEVFYSKLSPKRAQRHVDYDCFHQPVAQYYVNKSVN